MTPNRRSIINAIIITIVFQSKNGSQNPIVNIEEGAQEVLPQFSPKDGIEDVTELHSAIPEPSNNSKKMNPLGQQNPVTMRRDVVQEVLPELPLEEELVDATKQSSAMPKQVIDSFIDEKSMQNTTISTKDEVQQVLPELPMKEEPEDVIELLSAMPKQIIDRSIDEKSMQNPTISTKDEVQQVLPELPMKEEPEDVTELLSAMPKQVIDTFIDEKSMQNSTISTKDDFQQVLPELPMKEEPEDVTELLSAMPEQINVPPVNEETIDSIGQQNPKDLVHMALPKLNPEQEVKDIQELISVDSDEVNTFINEEKDYVNTVITKVNLTDSVDKITNDLQSEISSVVTSNFKKLMESSKFSGSPLKYIQNAIDVFLQFIEKLLQGLNSSLKPTLFKTVNLLRSATSYHDKIPDIKLGITKPVNMIPISPVNALCIDFYLSDIFASTKNTLNLISDCTISNGYFVKKLIDTNYISLIIKVKSLLDKIVSGMEKCIGNSFEKSDSLEQGTCINAIYEGFQGTGDKMREFVDYIKMNIPFKIKGCLEEAKNCLEHQIDEYKLTLRTTYTELTECVSF